MFKPNTTHCTQATCPPTTGLWRSSRSARAGEHSKHELLGRGPVCLIPRVDEPGLQPVRAQPNLGIIYSTHTHTHAHTTLAGTTPTTRSPPLRATAWSGGSWIRLGGSSARSSSLGLLGTFRCVNGWMITPTHHRHHQQQQLRDAPAVSTIHHTL